MFFRIVLGGLADDIATAIIKGIGTAITNLLPGVGMAIAIAGTIGLLLTHTDPMASYTNNLNTLIL